MKASTPATPGGAGDHSTGDRSGRLRLLKPVVVINDGLDDTAPEQLLPPSEVSRLFEIVRREAAAIDGLDDCLTMLRDVQRAKAALAELSADEIRAGLELRRLALDDPAPGSLKAPRTLL